MKSAAAYPASSAMMSLHEPTRERLSLKVPGWKFTLGGDRLQSEQDPRDWRPCAKCRNATSSVKQPRLVVFASGSDPMPNWSEHPNAYRRGQRYTRYVAGRRPLGRLLLVEDDEDSRDMYSEMLRIAGYVVVPAHDGEEALSLALKERFDLIILDIALPKVHGITVLRILREQPKTQYVPVITL